MALRTALCCMVLLLASQAAAQGSSAWKIQATSKEDAAAQTGGVSGGVVSEPLMDSMWQNFKLANSRTFSSVQEEVQAKVFFAANMRNVFKTNQDMTVPYWTSGNKFSDQDPAKLAATMLMKVDIISTRPSSRKLLLTEQQPEEAHTGRRLLQAKSVDWRTTGKVPAVRDQAQCGSCWAFAATAAIESAYLIAKNTTATLTGINLSEQQLVSCASNAAGYWSYGCDGGWSDMAMKYVLDRNLTTEAKYGYTSGAGVTGSCSSVVPTLKAGEVVQSGSGTPAYVTAKSETALRAAVDKQPVVIYFQVASSFYSYSGGIYKPTDCGTSINHAMVVVGYSYTGNKTKDYWIVRNSWGTWGDGGYIKVTMDGTANGPCGMYYYSAIYPALTFQKSLTDVAPTPPPPKPTPCTALCANSTAAGTPDYVVKYCAFCLSLVAAAQA